MSDPRDDLAALIWNWEPKNVDSLSRDDSASLADAILSAGWAPCQHPNASGFSNNNGPWQMRCAGCGKEWTEPPADDRSEWEGQWTPPTRCTSVHDMLWRCELQAGHPGPHEG